MRKISTFLLALLALSTTAQAVTPVLKDVDQINATGGSVLSVPSVGTVFMSDTNTVSGITNKSFTSPTIAGGALSGTFTGAPTLSGALSLTGGPSLSGAGTITSAFKLVDSTDATKALAFSLSGMTTAKTLTFSLGQTNSATLTIPNIAGGGDTMATLGATQTFGAGSTWNGVAIGSAYGGIGTTATPSNGQIPIGNGSGFALGTLTQGTGVTITNGGGSITIAATTPAPSLNGTVASPQSVTAGGGITLASLGYENMAIASASTSGTVTVTATPSITACTAQGQRLTIISGSSTNLITLQNNADLAGSQLFLNGPWTSGYNNGTPAVLNLVCDGAGTPHWVERGRSN